MGVMAHSWVMTTTPNFDSILARGSTYEAGPPLRNLNRRDYLYHHHRHKSY